MGIGNHETNVVGDGAHIGDVIFNPFQFEQNGAHPLRTRRNRDSRSPLHRLAESRAMRERRIAGDALGEKDGAVDGKIFKKFLGSLVRVEHAQLQVQDGLARDGEVEVAGLDDTGMNRADRNVEDALSVRGPVDVPFALEWRQHGVERKILAQRMHVGPVIVERHAPRIGVPGGFQAEPILNFALLPVDGRQLRGQRRKRRMIRGNGSFQNHPCSVVPPVENIVVVENTFLFHPVFGEDGHQPRLILGEKMPGDSGGIGTIQQNCDLIRDQLIHGADLLLKTLTKFFKKKRHCPLTTRAALLINSNSGAGTQNPITTSDEASASNEPLRQGRGAATGVSPPGPRIMPPTCSSAPAKTPALNTTKRTPVSACPPSNAARKIRNSL